MPVTVASAHQGLADAAHVETATSGQPRALSSARCQHEGASTRDSAPGSGVAAAGGCPCDRARWPRARGESAVWLWLRPHG